jgi:excisionase family DNA binding protein
MGLLLTVHDVARELAIGRTRVFALIASGELESVKVGRSRRVPAAALERFVDQLRNGEAA